MQKSGGAHIVLVGPAFPYRGGIAHFLEALHQELVNSGYTVTVVTFSRQYPALLFPGTTQLESETREVPFNSLRLIDSVNPFSWLSTARYIRNLQPDFVIFKYWLPFFAPPFGVIARMLKKDDIRILGIIHNALPHEARIGDRSLGRYFLRSCDGLVVLSGKVKEDLRSRLDIKAPLRQVEHPVYDIFGPSMSREEARETLAVSRNAHVLLFFGFIRKYKGLHVLLECMPLVVKKLPNLQLIIAGEAYEDEQLYHDLIQKYQLHPHVHLHMKYIPKENVKMYFAAADVVVQPYVSATQSGVAQIAYHFDRPLIVTDVGGLAEFVPHNIAGLVVPPENPEALAEAIVNYFTEEMSSNLIKGVQEEKKKYTWARLREAIEDLVAE